MKEDKVSIAYPPFNENWLDFISKAASHLDLNEITRLILINLEGGDMMLHIFCGKHLTICANFPINVI